MTNSINHGNDYATQGNADAKVLNNDELVTTIMHECRLAARRAKAKYGHHKMHDLEGTLIAQIWEVLMKKPESFHTVMMIRRLIKQRTINHIQRDLIPLNNQINFSMMGDKQNSDNDENFEDMAGKTLADNTDIELGTTLKAFRSTLSDKQRQILDLHTAGYGNNEIVDIVGCSINTPKNTMKKIKELAVSFGL